MKGFALIALLPLALAFTKRQAGTPPSCAVGCLADVSLNPAPCTGTDFVCLCTNTEIQAKITSCLTSSCAPDQIPVAVTFLQETCQQAGAPVPSAPAALGGSASAVASSAASSVGGAVSSASQAASSAAASASSALASISSSAAGVASSTASALASAASGGSSIGASRSSSLAAASSSTGAAYPTAMAKGFAAVGLGAVAGVLMM